MKDHFSRLGLKPSARIDLDELERRYLQESRRVHPDLSDAGADAGENSALLNEAYRILSDRWQRYVHLIEILSPGAMERTKQLDHDFLVAAMELGEDVEAARSDSNKRTAKKAELEADLERMAEEIEEVLSEEDRTEEAAVLCHQARYYHRALEILQREGGNAPL